MYSLLIAALWFHLLGISKAKPIPASSHGHDASNLIYIGFGEEHYRPSVFDTLPPDPVYSLALGNVDDTEPGIGSISGFRLETMNNNSIRMQIVSMANVPQALDHPDVVRAANTDLSRAIAPYPDRFRGMCYLPMAYPQQAVAELERCVDELGFVGVLVDDHFANGSHYDGGAWDVVWAALQRHDVPFYMHPTTPVVAEVRGAGGRFSPEGANFTLQTAARLAISGYGWHTDDGLAFVRLWLAGVFDRFPCLRLVLGHSGETMPYVLQRTYDELNKAKGYGVSIFDVWARNVWITTSGPFSVEVLAAALEYTSVDRVMYADDFPFQKTPNATAFMRRLRTSGLVTEDEWEKIAFRNAEKFLKIK